MNRYMNNKKISLHLKQIVQNYMFYQHENKIKRNLEEENYILNKISPNLKKQLLHQVYGKIINKFNCLKSNFSDKILMELLLII